MKRYVYIIVCLIILLNNKSFAQSRGIMVSYKGVFDTYRPVEIKGMLYALSTTSIYEEDMNSSKLVKKTPKQTENGNKQIITSPLVNDNVFYITDLSLNKVTTFDYINYKKISKVEDVVNINWELINEKKVIDHVECYKAITNFRGRKWEAWYAPSISFSVGPYKFNGLPGLIIKMNDETNQYNFAVEKIEYLEGDLYANKLKQVQSVKYDVIQTLQEFIKEREESIEASFDGADKKRGTELIREKPNRSGMELVYEWEKE